MNSLLAHQKISEISQEKLAEQIGVERVTISQWLLNPSKISLEKISRVFKAFEKFDKSVKEEKKKEMLYDILINIK